MNPKITYLFLVLLLLNCISACNKDNEATVPPQDSIPPPPPPPPVVKDSLMQWELIDTKIDADILDVCFKSDAIGFIGTKKGMYITSDTGATWQMIPNTDSGVTEIDFSNFINFGFASGNKYLYITRNNGQNWLRKALPILDSAEYGIDIDFGTINIGYYGTSKGIYRTVDTGNTWQKITSSFCRALDAESDNSIQYVTLPNYIYRVSYDSGRSWQADVLIKNSVASDSLVKCVLKNRRLSCANGMYFKGGGSVWPSLFFQQYSYTSTDFTNSEVYYKADNSIYYRPDAGITITNWTLSCLMRTERINSIFELSGSKYMWAACSRGKLLRKKLY